jgi:tyrosyl-tRNA synthetase
LANTKGIEAQIQRLWKNVAGLAERHMTKFPDDMQRDGLVLNNDEWLQKISIMDVLGTIGSGLRLGPLLGRDT